jgi:hypothetical protein
MLVVNVLTAGFASPNGRAFLMPLILHRETLRDSGLDVRLINSATEATADCDVLMIDGRVYSTRWNSESEAVLSELADFREKVRHLIYVSIADSAGWDHARALPHVSLYCKSQLLRDRRAYLKPLYGHRIYANYYHENFGVEDSVASYSEPALNESYLSKLAVSWNSGLGDYSWLGPFRMKLYEYLPLKSLLRFPEDFVSASKSRERTFSCRIGTNYARASVAFQRKQMAQVLAAQIPTNKVSRRAYLRELAESRIAVSPFGLGEISLRDFEIFMNGALLLKPDMSEVETWPNFFQDGLTMVAHRWDLSDLEAKIEAILSDPVRAVEIASEGQRVYRDHLIGPNAGEMFAKHLLGLIHQCRSAGVDSSR